MNKLVYIFFIGAFVCSCGPSFHTTKPKSDVKTRKLDLTSFPTELICNNLDVEIVENNLWLLNNKALIRIKINGYIKKVKRNSKEIFTLKDVDFRERLISQTTDSNAVFHYEDKYKYEIKVVPHLFPVEKLNKKQRKIYTDKDGKTDFDIKLEYILEVPTGISEIEFVFGDKIKTINLRRGK